MTRLRTSCLITLTLATAGPSARADVIVIDPARVVIDGKGLVLVADGGVARPVLGRLSVSNVPAGPTTVLRGLEFQQQTRPPFPIQDSALLVQSCPGGV